ncbi:MAG: GlcG/HbpS family heme-binding protein [Dehalococcoidia bacterium]
MPPASPKQFTRQTIQRRVALRGGIMALLLLVAGLLSAGNALVQAQTPPPLSAPRQTITLDAAQTMILAAEAKAREIGVPMVIAIVDESGVLKAYSRMDGSILTSVDIAQEKAITAVSFGIPTDVLAGAVKSDPTILASVANIPHAMLISGGLPIMSGTTLIGGIGVSGSLDPAQDKQVAEAALAVYAAGQ